MYEKPKLERFGTFRDLTRIGTEGDGDGGIYIPAISTTVASGCDLYAPGINGTSTCSR